MKNPYIIHWHKIHKKYYTYNLLPFIYLLMGCYEKVANIQDLSNIHTTQNTVKYSQEYVKQKIADET